MVLNDNLYHVIIVGKILHNVHIEEIYICYCIDISLFKKEI